MLKSLYSGVSGLQSHQIAMDVESNNIANVNTTGFKYSRANFSDLLAQVNQISTAPQGQLGGKNAVQVGLGSTVGSMTRIHSQGSIQNSDKNTDVAIQGDGFFVVSSDSGNTLKYTRAGDFKFDALGNFVDNNGFIVQGWSRDPDTNKVDSTAPISNIQIPPGLTTPAGASTVIDLKANLNSGALVQSFGPTTEQTMYNYQDYLDAKVVIGGGGIPSATQQAALDQHDINVANEEDVGVMFNGLGESMALTEGKGMWLSYKTAFKTDTILATAANTAYSFDINGVSVSGVLAAGATATENSQAIAQEVNKYSATTGVSASINGADINFENDNSREGDTDSAKNIIITSAATALGTGITDTDQLNASSAVTAYKYTYDKNSTELLTTTPPVVPGTETTFKSMETLRTIIQAHANQRIYGDNSDSITVSLNDRGQFEVKNPGDGDATIENVRFQITSFYDETNKVTTAPLFVTAMQSLNGTLTEGSTGIKLSQEFNAATHASSIDIFDSLGSKHTVTMKFRKLEVDPTTGTTWQVDYSVPEPAEINTLKPLNEISGTVRFTNEGALSNFTPTNLSFTGNNGSEANQNINLNLGTVTKFDGVTSFDSPSTTSGISQDGYPGGDLLGIRIDQSGTLVGSFSNGRSFGLAQLSMAKFANNEGLVTDGGNIYLQSANSGEPIVGTAANGGRGFIQSSALEASNVDLSRSLTQLIIIQRGYQANGKTITTSDQLLQTLIGLKN